MMTSRTRPVTRDARVNKETVEAVRSRFIGGAIIGSACSRSATPFAGAGALMLYSSSLLNLVPLQHGHLLQSQEEDSSHRVGPQARAPGREAERRQHGPSFEVPHRH